MRAIILAAGQSKRLRPLTFAKPKCLLSLGNETILDRQLNTLKKAGIYDIVMVVGYKQHKIRKHIARKHPDLRVVYIENPKYHHTHAGYSLSLAKKYLTDGALYLNADVVCHENIIHEVVSHPEESVTAIQKTPWLAEQVNVITDANGRIQHIGKQIPETDSVGEFIGVTKIGPAFAKNLIAVLEELDASGQHGLFAADTLNLVIQKYSGVKYVHDVSGYIAKEVDEVHEYEAIAQLIKEA